LQEVAYDAENLDNDQKEKVMERIELAKKFLNANSAIELLINWKSPWEIF